MSHSFCAPLKDRCWQNSLRIPHPEGHDPVPALATFPGLNRVDLLRTWRRETAKLQLRFGRPPTSTEIAACTDLANKQLQIFHRFLQASRKKMPSSGQLEQTVVEGEKAASSQRPSPNPLVHLLDLISELPDEAVALVLWRLGLSGEEPLNHAEIARRWQKTPQEVLHLEEVIFRHLRQELGGVATNLPETENQTTAQPGNVTLILPAGRYEPSPVGQTLLQ